MLHITCFLFTINVHHAFKCHDWFYHTAFLALTCTSVAYHWCNTAPNIKTIDKVLAHLCYALCFYTHTIEHPNVLGYLFLGLVLCIWVSEHHCQSWLALHCALHVVGCIGASMAIDQRCQ